MAFFKFRKGGDRQQTAASVHPESVEAMRRRAKHRLIGAAVLVIAGVVGFPLVFDTQPRPIAVDVPIVIPDKNSVKPLAMPAPAVAAASTSSSTPSSSSASGSSTVAQVVPDKVPANAALSPKEEIVTTPPKAPSAAAAVTPPPVPKPPSVAAASKPAAAPAAAAPAKNNDGAKALALLEGKAPDASTPTASDSGRFVVQVGAFADADKAREARMKVERSGLKTYTQVADTKDGKRTRVRVGPFASRAEADKAAAKIKGLDLSAAVLTL